MLFQLKWLKINSTSLTASQPPCTSKAQAHLSSNHSQVLSFFKKGLLIKTEDIFKNPTWKESLTSFQPQYYSKRSNLSARPIRPVSSARRQQAQALCPLPTRWCLRAVVWCTWSGPSRKQGSTHTGLMEQYRMKGLFAEEQARIWAITRDAEKDRGEREQKVVTSQVWRDMGEGRE